MWPDVPNLSLRPCDPSSWRSAGGHLVLATFTMPSLCPPLPPCGCIPHPPTRSVLCYLAVSEVAVGFMPGAPERSACPVFSHASRAGIWGTAV